MKRFIIALGLAALAATGVAMSTSDSEPAARAGTNLNSFLPDTVVLKGDGTRARLDTFAAGDLVRATDPATGQTSTQKVLEVIRGQGERHMYGLDIDGAPADQRIFATVGHAFFVRGKGYTPIEEIERGDALVQPGNRMVLVRQVEDLGVRTATVLNLRVSGPRTFTVVSNREPIITFGA